MRDGNGGEDVGIVMTHSEEGRKIHGVYNGCKRGRAARVLLFSLSAPKSRGPDFFRAEFANSRIALFRVTDFPRRFSSRVLFHPLLLERVGVGCERDRRPMCAGSPEIEAMAHDPLLDIRAASVILYGALPSRGSSRLPRPSAALRAAASL